MKICAKKIFKLNDLLTELSLQKTAGKTIVFTNGCYDILHVGHIRFLNNCREYGSILVVGVNSDISVREQKKGSNRPIIKEDQRAEVIANLQSVDYVVLFDEKTPEKIIKQISPDVLIKGSDWKKEEVAGREHVESNGGKLVLLPLVEGISTSIIIDCIRQNKRVPPSCDL